MTIEVEGPDGATVEFPDGTHDDVIHKAMLAHYGAPKERPKGTLTLPERAKAFAGREIDKAVSGLKDLGASPRPGDGLIDPQLRAAGGLGKIASVAGDVLNLPFRPLEKAAGDLTEKLPQIHGPESRIDIGPVHLKSAPYNPRWGEEALDTGLMALGEDAPGALSAKYRAAGNIKAADRIDAQVAASVKAKAAASPAAPASAGAAPAAPGLGAGTPATRYRERVDRLAAQDVELTPGMIKGGDARRQEEAHKSHPLWGAAVRDAENKAITSFNRATYNQVLKPIGETVSKAEVPDDLVGREGVGAVEKKIGDRYEKLLPQVQVKPDEALLDDLMEVKANAKLLGPYEATLHHIIDDRIVKRIGPDGMDGHQFKRVESELSHLARSYGSSGDAAQRMLGDYVEDIQGALRDNMERSSPPQIREELKKTNQAWAAFTRLRGAAANRATSNGVFTVGDLLAGVKRQDKSAGKGAFARGDALLQDFAEDANAVIPNRLPDSGTPERLARNKMAGGVGAAVGGTVGGLPGAGIGLAAGEAFNHFVPPITNRLAAVALQQRAAKALNPGQTRNYLKQATGRAVHPAALAAGLAGAVDQSNNGGQ